MSANSKRRRATSPCSSVSGAGDPDDASTPGSGRKKRKISNVPPVDTVSASFHCTVKPERTGLSRSVSVLTASAPFFPCRLLFAMSCLMLLKTTRMIKGGNSLKFSLGFQRGGIIFEVRNVQSLIYNYSLNIFYKSEYLIKMYLGDWCNLKCMLKVALNTAKSIFTIKTGYRELLCTLRDMTPIFFVSMLIVVALLLIHAYKYLPLMPMFIIVPVPVI